jgi:hypothetical protein
MSKKKNLKKKETLEEALQAKMVLKEKALYMQKTQQARDRGGSGRRDRGESSQSGQSSSTLRGRGRSQESKRKLNVDCYNCSKHGHYARNCWAEKKVKDKANYVEVIKDEKLLLMAQTPSTLGCDTMWYLDIGANNYITGHKHLFVEMIEFTEIVFFGDASKVEVKGKYNVKFL